MKDIIYDPIEISVRKQLEAFAQAGTLTFKVQCIPDAELRGQPCLLGHKALQPWKPWRWSGSHVLQNLPMLKRRNLEGYNIFIAPLPDNAGRYAPLVFVDDILSPARQRMRADGLEPAILIESSPKKFQGWIAFDATSFSGKDILRIQRSLVARYGLDIGAVGADQNGRLAGFRNVKAKYLERRIFSKLIRAEPTKAKLDLIFEDRPNPEPRQPVSHPHFLTEIRPPYDDTKIESFWLQKIGTVSKPSESEREFSACLACLRKGFGAADVERVLFKLGDNLLGRKGSETAAWDYVRRTVRKAKSIVSQS